MPFDPKKMRVPFIQNQDEECGKVQKKKNTKTWSFAEWM